MCISRIVEELFPFVHYLKRTSYLRKRCKSKDILREEGYADYQTLSLQQLEKRLEEERQRASAIDEKSFKLTLSLSIGLTVLGLMVAFFSKSVSSAILQKVTAIIIGISLFYVLAAGLVALGALRTSQSYGYGTQFLLLLKKNSQTVLANALARQEIMNTIRHLRNETAYQALRNGLLFLFAGILVFLVIFV